MPIASFEALNDRVRGGRGATARQPAQRRGRQPAPEGPGDHRQARLVVLGVPARRGGRRPRRSRRTTRRSTSSVELGFPVNPEIAVVRLARRGRRVLPALARSTATTSATRSTAWSSRSTTSPSATARASRRGRRAGRSPTSSRPRSARRCCATSRCRSAAPAGRRRSPCSSRCSSAGRRWRWRRCTTRTRCAVKDVRPGDTVIVRKAGDVIPEVVGPVLSLRPKGAEPWAVPDRRARARCGSTLVRPEGEADTRCVEPGLPVPARPADHLLRVARGDGHRGPRRAHGDAAHRRRPRRATPPTSTRSRPSSCSSSRASRAISAEKLVAAIEGRSTGRCRGC